MRCLTIGVGVVVLGLAATRAPAEETLWLAVERPTEDQRVRLSAPLVEVRGRTLLGEPHESGSGAGIQELVSADVVLALDLSNTSLMAMGVDVDGDGKVGRDRPALYGWPRRSYRSWTTDPDDTIIHSELLAARTLVDRLGERRARLGILTYTGKARARAEVGSPEQAILELERIRIRVDWTGTDISRALRLARDMLLDAPPRRGPSRPRIVVLFSDGKPTVPRNEHVAERSALRAARALTEDGVQVYTLAFGEDAREEPGVLQKIAEITGGRFVEVEDPARVLEELAKVEFVKPAGLLIRNITTEQIARAVRVFTDGSFDGFVPLAPGWNRLEVSAIGPDGERVGVERRVFYEKPEVESLEDRRRAARMLVELRHRAAETELASQTVAGSRRQRDLEIYPEPPSAP